MAELQRIAWWRCVWGWWRALAFYNMRDHYERLEDVPEGMLEFTIQTKHLNTRYYLSMGNQITQVIDVETCKKFYG
ncbi:hypothetical protein EHS13_20195 [Paenibacillus psychroresistens]|uniref:Uncharacterized protein n=1 Tax=Paenibacillus psychroresistens TaxID=1778678 RepID=A0A6B8RL54_9BACL|nr:hypothetical protein EHS13_20195 [Paenibacillus psychroresistens]